MKTLYIFLGLGMWSSSALAGDPFKNIIQDITKGPGPNNDLIRPLEQKNRELQRGINEILNGRPPPPAQLGTIGGKRVCFPWC